MQLKKYRFILVVLLALVSRSSYAADVMVIASNTGSQLGKATYCGFETEEFARRAGRAIDHYSTGEKRVEAVRQFMFAAQIAARSGPIGESCSEFKRGYLDSLAALKEANF